MAVRLKFANDLNIFGSSRGAGGFLSTPVLIGGGYPAYGTVLSTAYGVDYEDGSSQVYSGILASWFYSKTCDVDTKADGSGGSFVDFGSASNIQFKANGTFVATSSEDIAGNAQEVPFGSSNYYNSGSYSDRNEVHNGSGNIDTVGTGTFTLFLNGTVIVFAYNEETYVPSPNGTAYANGQYSNYVWDGNGGYGTAGDGSYYSNGTEVDSGLRYTTSNEQTEVPPASGVYYDNGKFNQDTYLWNGSGGYTGGGVAGNPQGSFFPFGQFITDNDCPTIGVSGVGLGYFWDGNNGWYIASYP